MNATQSQPGLLGEAKYSLGTIGAYFGQILGRNKPVKRDTVKAWAEKGVEIGEGRIVKLEVVRCGSRTVTSYEAAQRFLAAQNIKN